MVWVEVTVEFDEAGPETDDASVDIVYDPSFTVDKVADVTSVDEDGDVMYVASAVDTLTDGGGAVLLPFGQTAIGTFFKLVIVDGAADEGNNLLNLTKIYRRHTVIRDHVGRR